MLKVRPRRGGARRWPAALLAAFSLAATAAPASAAVDLLFLPRVEAEVLAGDVDAAILMLEEAIRDAGNPPEIRLELIDELTPLYLAEERFAEAGEAFAIATEFVRRMGGATDPSLPGYHMSAGEAFARAGELPTALRHFRTALDLDARYLDCASETLAADHARIADLLATMGLAEESARERRAADDGAYRCALAGQRPGERGIVAESQFAGVSADSFSTVQVFYATDRARTGSLRPNDFYGGERGPTEYGTLDVTVPRIHKPGLIESPSAIRFDWNENPERHVLLTRVETLTADEMFGSMRALLADRGSDEAFVFVHGFNSSFADAAKLVGQMTYDLNFDGAPILYSWPSAARTLAYLSDEAAVELSARKLKAFLEDLVGNSGATRINLIAHSMGSRALAVALELLATQLVAAGLDQPVFEQIIFAAPDVDAGLFAAIAPTIAPIARRITLYASENDVALGASKTLHGAIPRAGQGGDMIFIGSAVDSIEMSALGGDMLGHGYFHSQASALTDILWLFWRDTGPGERCGIAERTIDRGRYWEFGATSCDGLAVLSALTLLRREGADALAVLDRMIAEAAGIPGAALPPEEWQAIREILLAEGTVR
jgi:esterase/lipase superfamily enzyme